MRRRPSALLAAAVAVAVATGMTISATTAPAVAASPEPGESGEPAAPATGLIVQLKESGGDLAAVAETADAELPRGVEVADTTTGAAGTALVSLDEAVAVDRLDDAVAALDARPDVEWVLPNRRRYAASVPNDPGYHLQWNLNGTYGINAAGAWDVTTGANTVVAVVDTGITAHEEFAGQTVAGRDFVSDPTSARDGDGWDTNPADPGDGGGEVCDGVTVASTWHGTHVAGLVAARQDNGLGISGVAPGAKIQPVRALGACGGSDWDIAMAILWAAGAKVNPPEGDRRDVPLNPTPAKIINLSLAGLAYSAADARAYCRFYGQVASIARGRGATLIAAAGNEGSNHALNLPSSCPGFVSVAATGPTGAVAPYSNRGAGLDVAAPGGVAARQDSGILSTLNFGTSGPDSRTNAYAWMAGTSMATPQVSGVAALLWARGIRNPNVIERVLKGTANRFGGCAVTACGAGVVDASRALTTNAPTVEASISGTARVGGLLTATPGAWLQTPTATTLTWYRGSRAVLTGRTYRVTAADLGATISVRETAAGTTASVYATAAVAVPRASSSVRFAAPAKVKKSKRARVTIRVSGPYTRPTGSVSVYDGRRRIAVRSLSYAANGTVRIKLPRLKKGVHRIRVVYSGSSQFASSTTKVRKLRST